MKQKNEDIKMIHCPICGLDFFTERGLNKHFSIRHKYENVPDLLGLGIVKRGLTPAESKQITKEIMEMNIKDSNLRFNLAIIKSIDITNKETQKK